MADSAALGAQVPEEPAVPGRERLVLVRLVLVRRQLLADLLLRPAVVVPARLAVPVQRPVPADPLLEERPVPAHLVAVELLLSRQSFSAAMARTTP